MVSPSNPPVFSTVCLASPSSACACMQIQKAGRWEHFLDCLLKLLIALHQHSVISDFFIKQVMYVWLTDTYAAITEKHSYCFSIILNFYI